MSLKDMLCDMDGCAGQGRMIVVCKDCWEQQQKHLEQQQAEIERLSRKCAAEREVGEIYKRERDEAREEIERLTTENREIRQDIKALEAELADLDEEWGDADA